MARDAAEAYPRLSGALAGLGLLEARDLERYRNAMQAGRQQGWGYYFPYLLSHNRPGRSAALWAEDGGSLCMYLWSLRRGRPHLDVYLTPLPMKVAVLTRCIERANDHNGDRSARVMRIDAGDAAAVGAVAGLTVRQRRLQYLYAPASYGALHGKKFYTIRRNVAQVEALPDVEVVPYTPALADGCRDLLRRWRRHYRSTRASAGGTGTSKRAIELAGHLPETVLRGEVVLLDGRVAAFAFGGEIRPGVASIFDTRSDNDVRGLAYFHRYRFLSALVDYARVNDGSDTGRGGLRQFKDSFRPVEMLPEFRAVQRRRDQARQRLRVV
jgi:hypothetical protein